ncbi:hypothetical protein TWF694_008384 [Orbilia ellipsospora]|uniref:Uncharacterized protein n=1 Tax=Orbilia ellipsospora TaxID=2528407 RepID=A0AAV9XGF7_9PEZI
MPPKKRSKKPSKGARARDILLRRPPRKEEQELYQGPPAEVEDTMLASSPSTDDNTHSGPSTPLPPRASTPPLFQPTVLTLSGRSALLNNRPGEKLLARPTSHPHRSKVWGRGLFQSQEHIDIVNKVSGILDLHGYENIWQPLDPLETRETVESIMMKLWHHCILEVDGPGDQDMLLIIGAAAFMRLGCRFPKQFKTYLIKILTQNPLPPTIKLTDRATDQLKQALEIYKPGTFYIFETAPELEMLPLLADTQNFERDIWGTDLTKLINTAKEAEELFDAEESESMKEGKSKATESLRKIVERSGLNPNETSLMGSDLDFDTESGTSMDEFDSGSGCGRPTRAVSLVGSKGTISRKSSLRGEGSAMGALSRIASNAGLNRKPSLLMKNSEQEDVGGLVKGIKNLFTGGGKKKENETGP